MLAPVQKKTMTRMPILFLATVFLFACNSTTNNLETATAVPAPTEITLDRPHYQLKYFSNWTIDSSDTDFNIDNYFTFNSASNGGQVTFFIYNVPIDEQEHIDAQVKAHLDKVLKNGTVSYFNSWGQYKGHGAKIKGKYQGIFNAEVKIFAHSGDTCSFLTASQINDSDREKDLPGLQLIERTFKMK